MNVYVVIHWFYEGDGNLVDSFVGAFKSYELALSNIPKDGHLLCGSDFDLDGDPFYDNVSSHKNNFEIRIVSI